MKFKPAVCSNIIYFEDRAAKTIRRIFVEGKTIELNKNNFLKEILLQNNTVPFFRLDS